MSKKKIHGQVFTPVPIAEQMLDTLGYTHTNLNILKQKIMEPSSGTGVFLKLIVERLIRTAREAGCDNASIAEIVDNNVYGIELDHELYSVTCAEIISQCEDAGVYGVQLTNVIHGNTLDYLNDYDDMFDYVIGNPPYVRIHNISDQNMSKVKSLCFATGNTDLYVAFFEIGINMLALKGKLAYITPNSFLKNTSQGNFRKYLSESHLIDGLVDYRSAQVFDDASTYATITYLSKKLCCDTSPSINVVDDLFKVFGEKALNTPLEGAECTESVSYQLEVGGSTHFTSMPLEALRALDKKPWNFADPKGVLNRLAERSTTVQDVAYIQNGVCTQQDKVFIDHKSERIDEKTTMFNGYPVESELLRGVVKGSKYRGEKITGRIIFPYRKVSYGKYTPYMEKELPQKYPLAYTYFLAHRDALLKRKIDSHAVSWFQFGRSQSVNTVDTPKFLVPTVFHPDKTISVHYLPAGTIVYSGMYLMIDDDVNSRFLVSALESRDFTDYAAVVGKDLSGGFVYVSAQNIRDYRY